MRLSSILCDMGDMVSIVDNSEKSYKMINMSDIFGMSRENMEILALVSKYSGDLIPRDSNTDFSTVKRKNRVTENSPLYLDYLEHSYRRAVSLKVFMLYEKWLQVLEYSFSEIPQCSLFRKIEK